MIVYKANSKTQDLFESLLLQPKKNIMKGYSKQGNKSNQDVWSTWLLQPENSIWSNNWKGKISLIDIP